MQSASEFKTQQQDPEEERFTFRDLARDWWVRFMYGLRHWRLVGLAAIVAGLLFMGYALIKKPTYTARLTFIVEESKAGGGSLASALAGQFGFDIGSLAGGNGILAGDNVLELLKSQSFIKKTLLTAYADSSAQVSLADRYADVYGWKEKWKNSSDINRQVNFPVGQARFSRLEDSLLQRIMKRISEEELSISKPDKKLGVFELTISTRDELLSQEFCERLLKIATDFYVETKTRRLTNNILRLQRRADSLGGLLDRRTVSSAETERLLLDVNPAYSSPMANAEISSRNKLIQSTIYAEVIKNLEISRTALAQETPTVQVVDEPELPLKKNRLKPLIALLAGLALGGAVTVIVLAIGYRKQPL